MTFDPFRRRLMLATLAAGFVVVGTHEARAEDDESPPGSDERPRKADILVFAEGDQEGKIIRRVDIPLAGPPVLAWPMDPVSKVVRSGSRLNELLVQRFEPADLDDETRGYAADGIVAYSAVCAHAGCPVTGWVKDGDREVLKCPCHNSEYDPRQGAEVVMGPAQRHLARLPLVMSGDAITVAAPFIGKVGPQQTS